MCKACQVKKSKPCGCKSNISGMKSKKNNRINRGAEIALYGALGFFGSKLVTNFLPVSGNFKELVKVGAGVGTLLLTKSDMGMYAGAGMISAGVQEFAAPYIEPLFAGLGNGGSDTVGRPGAARLRGTPLNQIHKVAGRVAVR